MSDNLAEQLHSDEPLGGTSGCHCSICNPKAWWMIVCPLCGNKRCPHAESHRLQCTGSNTKDQVATLLPKGQLAIRPDLAPVRALTEQDLSLLLAGLASVIEVAKVPMDMVREIVGPNPSGIAAELLANMSRGIGGFEHCRALLADRWRHKNAEEKEAKL